MKYYLGGSIFLQVFCFTAFYLLSGIIAVHWLPWNMAQMSTTLPMKENQYFLELAKKHMMLKTRAWHFWKKEPIQTLSTQYDYSCDYKYSFFFQL